MRHWLVAASCLLLSFACPGGEKVLSDGASTQATQDGASATSDVTEQSGSGAGDADSSAGASEQEDAGDAPANILDAVFDELPTESTSSIAIAIDEFVKQTASVESEDDKGLGAKIGEFVKEKLADAIEKGEEWVEQGGIRELIKNQVTKMTDGKLSDADQQHLLNMVDGICNVNKDGGQSFVQSLGTDGLPVAKTLAINALKKQVSEALPDQADIVNGMLDVLKNSSTTAELKKNALSELQKIIAEKIPYENSAKVINDVIQKIADNKAIDVLPTIKTLGKSIATDALKDVLSKNINPMVAEKIGNVLDGVCQNGLQGGLTALRKEVDDIIDKYAPGTDSAESLKKLVDGALNGKITVSDITKTTTAVVTDLGKNLIDKTNLPQEVKDLAKTGLDGLIDSGLTGLTQNIGDYIEDYVSEKLGTEAGKAVGEIFDAVVTPSKDAWAEVIKQAPVIGKAIGQKVLAKVEQMAVAQIDKWIAKCPTLKKVLDALGINGKGIVQGIKNVIGVLWGCKGNFSQAISQLSQMALKGLKTLAKNLINSLLQWGLKFLFNNIIPKAVDWASKVLTTWSNSTDNALIKKGLDYLKAQLQKVKSTKSISIKTDNVSQKIVDWVEQKAKAAKAKRQTGGQIKLQGGH